MPPINYDFWLEASGLWSDPTNWSGGVPSSFSSVMLGGTGSYTALLHDATNRFAAADLVYIADPNATLTVANNTLNIGSSSQGGLVNYGTLSGLDGSNIVIGYNNRSPTGTPGGTFENHGVIKLTSGIAGLAILEIDDNIATAALGNFQNDGLVFMLGSLDNTGATLVAGNYGDFVFGGVVEGGTIIGNGGTPTGTGGILHGVTVEGQFFVGSDPFTFDPASTMVPLPGQSQATLEAFSSAAIFQTTGTVDNLLVRLPYDGGGGIGLLGTLGANTNVVSTGSAWAGAIPHAVGAIELLGTITNSASLNVAAQGNAGLIRTAGALSRTTFWDGQDATLDNAGTIAASDGGFVIVQDVLSGTGTLEVSAGGTIQVQKTYAGQAFAFGPGGGTIQLAAAGSTHDVLGFAPGDTIEFLGRGATLSFDAGTLSVTNGPFAVASLVMHGVPANARFNVATDQNLNAFITETVPCFAAGTRILAPAGWIEVGRLRPGDTVLLALGGTAPVQWVGHRNVNALRHPNPEAVWPIRIRAGALAPGRPGRDLLLSPEHCLLLDGVLVPAGLLANGTSIVRDRRDAVSYWHVELPRHDVLLAEGLPCESYLDLGNRADFDNGRVVAAHPRFAGPEAGPDALAIWRAHACAPQCRGGPRLDAIRAWIAARGAPAAAGITDRRPASPTAHGPATRRRS